ncbi:hypothetical protein FEM48_Zijuj01G0269800 [Ziziphus jujuba var. spinosa]|uniref:Uncharacterized protein n=1 Tax=Ziziphus jujuba var. spinosa TaxID=714518 RepID=A0A978W552_ZIZJJ|nr:hypothetical protein FEM48_Zijuj01G0269800 [Ziziphus jujuba var. spinosa]
MVTVEEPEPDSASDHILDWLEDSVSFIPSFLDEPHNSREINGYHWWAESQDITHDLINTSASINSPPAVYTDISTAPANPTISNHNQQKSKGRRINKAEDGDIAAAEAVVPPPKESGGNKERLGNNCNNGNVKEGRWEEQLLNPRATAITAGNLTRVQHLLYVLHEPASPAGDRRLLTHHLSSSSASYCSASEGHVSSKISTLVCLPIQHCKILQSSKSSQKNLTSKRNLHILDVGVSHSVRWPTLLAVQVVPLHSQ